MRQIVGLGAVLLTWWLAEVVLIELVARERSKTAIVAERPVEVVPVGYVYVFVPTRVEDETLVTSARTGESHVWRHSHRVDVGHLIGFGTAELLGGAAGYVVDRRMGTVMVNGPKERTR